MIGGCPLNSTYDFTIPTYAPAGQALFAWTWQNFEGNREYYMNCAAVEIARSPFRHRRQTYSGFDSLPYIWKANLQGVNSCTTSANENPVYPHPGPDVEYGSGLTSASPSTSGDCDEPLPYGKTYKQDDASKSSASAPGNLTVPYGGWNTSSSTHPVGSAVSSTTTAASASFVYAPTPTPSGYQTVYITTTVTAPDCQATPSTPAYASHNTSTLTDKGFSSATFATYTRPSTTAASSTAYASTASSTPAYSHNETYANAHYLPCVPGTFICASSSSFLTCDANDGSDPNVADQAYIYDYIRSVAAGMECVAHLSPYSGATEGYGQQNLSLIHI